MLTAIVLQLKPLTPTCLPLWQGTFAYGAELARAPHQSKPHNPFTVSPLLDADAWEGSNVIVRAEQIYCWRVRGLRQEVCEHLVSFSP